MADKADIITKERVNPDTGEVLTTTAPAMRDKSTEVVMIDGKAHEVVKLVNLPTLKHESGKVVAFRVDAPIRIETSKREEEVTMDGVKKTVTIETPINVVRVTEWGSKQPFEYVCNAMTADNLRSAYPDHEYVGRIFAVQKLGLVAGKRYKETNIIELAAEGTAQINGSQKIA